MEKYGCGRKASHHIKFTLAKKSEKKNQSLESTKREYHLHWCLLVDIMQGKWKNMVGKKRTSHHMNCLERGKIWLDGKKRASHQVNTVKWENMVGKKKSG